MKGTSIIILVVGVLVAGAIVFAARTQNSSSGEQGAPKKEAVSVGENIIQEEGRQIVEIVAKGGYSPRNTIAKANTPTVLRMRTNGTYDCSSALSIPALGVRDNLPPSGVKEYVIPAQQPGAVIQATCSMGMYSFQVAFE